MNDRIKDMALDAIVRYPAVDAWVFTDEELKKFAELIIKECAEICLEANDHKNILRHFGLEE